ncbi:MAG: class I SAM-dependent methyltransferase, partial [Ktedonobacterales bacterium]
TVGHGRDVFQTGAYLTQFRPDDTQNPFRRIYARKRSDVLALAERELAGKPDARVLDLGGGMGRVAVSLAHTYHVDLADISTAMLQQAEARAEQANVASGHLSTHVVDASQSLPYADANFDLVVCLDLLVHLSDPQAAIQEIFRVLRPGGLALIDASNSVPLWVFCYPRYVGKRPARWVNTLRHGGVLPEWASIVHHMRHARFQSWLSAADFRVEGERQYGPLPLLPKWFLAIVRRPL